MKSTDEVIQISQSFNCSIGKVWEAITETDQMKIWYFEQLKDFKPEVGFETQFSLMSGETRFTHQWKITEVKSQQMITYQWSYEEYPGLALVVFKLSNENNQTTLQIENSVIEDFPDNVPEFKRESAVGGWTYLIKESLKKYLSED